MTRTEDAAGAEARELGEALRRLLGPDNVLDDTEAREFFAQDLSNRRLARPALVIQPETVEDLAGAVRTATGTGFAVVPRGGGMSYTLGYLPAVEKSVSVDLRKLDRIVEINTDDMYVIVEAGVTWGQLHAALDDIGMRTPFLWCRYALRCQPPCSAGMASGAGRGAARCGRDAAEMQPRCSETWPRWSRGAAEVQGAPSGPRWCLGSV